MPLGKAFSIAVPDADGNVVNIKAKDAPPLPKRWFEFWRSVA
jgi:hypothetical protein